MAGRRRAGHRRRAAACRSPSRGTGTGGRRSCRTAAWRTPHVRHHADAGLDNQLAFLDAALDYVATHTPADRDTRYLEAVVTAWYDDDPPHTVVLRSVDRDVP